MNKTLTNCEQALHVLHELLELVVLLDLLELKTTIMGVGGWLRISLIIRLSQPSLAGVGAGAELGNI